MSGWRIRATRMHATPLSAPAPSCATVAASSVSAEITMNTPLTELSKFFEWNSAAVVTERVDGEPRAIAVVTKVDLLTWMVRQGTTNGTH